MDLDVILLYKQIWIGIDYFLLNFFATFVSTLGLKITVTSSSVLGLQVTVGLQVNIVSATNTLEPFVAGTMLRRPETNKERVEPTLPSIIAIEITRLTRFPLLFLLQIQRYMWRNHVATWT